ncbi:hypothetical protein [Flavihumibacter petaseus]|uniref:Lipoprotein n=1 Tax=Flavihumibacter petaseus NBRC 106054 TaxID=1220578 RepID=A0A0E9MVR4_9BACT|nr:hypothetical protein [Flavihumibacter petaseus]GAO41501.1 hypothetical protein FPE01S_01_05150 [Flavihumibacter petaseus NBRC 106054]
MLPRNPILASLLITVIATSSCGVLSKSDRVEYDYNEGAKKRRLVLAIPPGSVSENHSRDNDGNVVRTFQYKDGASFFIACRDGAHEPSIVLTKSESDMLSLEKATGQIGSGKYDNGTHWSRQTRDGFIVGYDSVANGNLEIFDAAIHSVQVKK